MSDAKPIIGGVGLWLFACALFASSSNAQPLGPDCNNNGIPDDQDIANGTSPDCNSNGIPDECDIGSGTSEDVNQNGIPDSCERIYVDADAPPGGNGTSWASAFSDLQDALATGFAGLGQIWVAEGVYTPAPPNGDKTLSFNIPDGVSIYGGFAGTEVSLLQQDFVAHVTVLSGDLNGNDPSSTFDNSYHVVRNFLSFGGQQINGFHIRGGHANQPGASFLARRGGGILTQYGEKWVLANCRIYDNKALDSGGGMFCLGVSPEIVNCVFYDNTAGNPSFPGYGGAIHGIFSAVRIANCVFSGNKALSYSSKGGFGGALAMQNIPRVTILNSTFSGNFATHEGGGLFYFGNSTFYPGNTSIRNSIFWGNQDASGLTEDAQISFHNPPAQTDVQYCCIQGLNTLTGPGDIGLDPLFVDAFGPDLRPGTADDDLHLTPASPCIDSARNAALPEDVADIDRDRNIVEELPLDLDLLPRRDDDPNVPDTGKGVAPIVDMGPFERQVP